MVNKRGHQGRVQGRDVLRKSFFRVLRVARDAGFFTYTAY